MDDEEEPDYGVDGCDDAAELIMLSDKSLMELIRTRYSEARKGGDGTYGMATTMGYRPAASGQCDPGPHSTRGTLCDVRHVFSFVFPAVVGMMEGANLSGDLANPGHSIPIGTIFAVSTAFLCYVLLILGQAPQQRAPRTTPWACASPRLDHCS